jgi:hypothetical protein
MHSLILFLVASEWSMLTVVERQKEFQVIVYKQILKI